MELLGLSHEQAIVYKTLIENGFMKAGSIPKYAKIKRGLVYKVLEQLIEMGLVEKHGGDLAVARYSPLSPNKLEMFVEKKQKQAQETQNVFESIYGNLKSQFNLLSGKPSVQYFEGLEGVERMFEDILFTDDTVYTYADAEAVAKYFPELNKKHVLKRQEKSITKKILIANNKLGVKTAKAAKKDPLTEIKIISKKFDIFASVMEVYDNKIAYVTMSKFGISGVLVEDKQIAQMHKFIFEALWDKSEKI